MRTVAMDKEKLLSRSCYVQNQYKYLDLPGCDYLVKDQCWVAENTEMSAKRMEEGLEGKTGSCFKPHWSWIGYLISIYPESYLVWDFYLYRRKKSRVTQES